MWICLLPKLHTPFILPDRWKSSSLKFEASWAWVWAQAWFLHWPKNPPRPIIVKSHTRQEASGLGSWKTHLPKPRRSQPANCRLGPYFHTTSEYRALRRLHTCISRTSPTLCHRRHTWHRTVVPEGPFQVVPNAEDLQAISHGSE